jgi:hypothetical protein
MATGLRAEVHDPLWLLARQGQFGELRGEDAGSPVWVVLEGECGQLTRYHPGPPDSRPGRPWDGRQPLEELVESEPEGDHPLRLAAEAGLHFLKLLGEEGVDRYAPAYLELGRYRLPDGAGLDPATQRFLAVLRGRAPDGTTLHQDLADAADGLPAEPPIASGDDTAAVLRAAGRFRAWYAALAGPAQPSAWMPGRFEYQFAVASPLPAGEAVLTASEYDQGRLDWHAFDLASAGITLGAAGDANGSPDLRHGGLPVPVTYRGMPAPRFWQFENAAVDFGDQTASRTDLTRLLLIEFATVYGNDHFVVPIQVQVGSVCRINRLVVTDTFGRETKIPHIANADTSAHRPGLFRLFELGTGGARSPLFLLPPALGPTLDGSPVEEVHILRDEGANLAWGVEVTAALAGGFPLDRAGAWQAGADAGPPPTGESLWRYRLRTVVPDYWFPLVPVTDQPGVNHLELGSLARLDGTPAPPPWGRVLGELAGLAVPEEEAARSGARILRAWQYARWIDGRQHVWLGRRRQSQAPLSDSGLLFDVVEPTTGPAS